MSSNELSLPKFFADHMVLQRGEAAPVWGWAKAGEKVTVAVGGQSASGVAGPDGKWRVKLAAMEAGGPTTMEVRGDSGRLINFKDVHIGEVWVCSGQSNMEWPVKAARDADAEMAAGNYPMIRQLYVPHVGSAHPREDVDAVWSVCTPQTVGDFTAVGYFFARELHQKLGVPIGLLHTSWGGTPAEAWTDRATLVGHPQLKPMVDRVETVAAEGTLEKFQKAQAAWQDSNTLKDPGNKGVEMGWASPKFDASDWPTMHLPQLWDNVGLAIDGAVWFRREVDIPAKWTGKDLALNLGPIDDFDTTYFDGEQVGETGKETMNWWLTARKYTVPGRLVKAGKRTIAVRVFDQMWAGGFAGTATQMKLQLPTADEAIELAGDWKYKIEYQVDHKPQTPSPEAPLTADNPMAACSLFNGMLNPLIPYGIKGAIWYQGESNAGRAEQYKTLMRALITTWRKHWGQGDFPFVLVQLANFLAAKPEPAESEWAELREAQRMAMELPNVGMATAVDIGDAVDIHPINKQDVGKRLAFWAEKIVYGLDLAHCGPSFVSMQVEGSTLRLKFNHTAGGLTAKGGKLKGFAIAGADKKFVWADARIEKDSVLVTSEKIKTPVAVRYGWADNPEITLYNTAGLPASPFRTDNWPWITAGRT